MSTISFRLVLLGLLLSGTLATAAQKGILLSDALAAGADKLPVKMGTQWFGKIWKFRFGDYAVVDSKQGWTSGSTRSNFLNTRTESRSSSKFSFTLAGKGTDVAGVNAIEQTSVKELRAIQLFPNFYWGDDELLEASNKFTALITVNGDTSDVWALVMTLTAGQDDGATFEGFLTNGTRKIVLEPVSSNKNMEPARTLPALGYELVEGGRPLGALQYWGGGMMGANKNIVWIDRALDDRTRLLLAAAMTAVLQVKTEKL